MKYCYVLPSIFCFNRTLVSAVTLFNGFETSVFPLDTPEACFQVFDASLPCDQKLHLLYKQTDWTGWNASDLSTLCTSDCRSSLTTLKDQAASFCGSTAFPLGGVDLDLPTVVDFYLYKFDLTCLADGDSWCLLEQNDWVLEALPSVTWPTYTDKTYPDWSNDPVSGMNKVDENGTVIPPYNTAPIPVPTWSTNQEPASLDYAYIGPPAAAGDLNSTGILEYDEYPLEIQCSNCFLDRFKLGFATRWGESYDDVKGQAWDNMRLNCELTDDLYVYPSLDQSGPPKTDRLSLSWTSAKKCGRNITFTAPFGEQYTCVDFGLEYGVPSSSIGDVTENVNCRALKDGTYCVPLACEVAQHNTDGGQTMYQLLEGDGPYSSMSSIQFMRWNPTLDYTYIGPNEVFCVGPPGGSYTPPPTTVTVANPTVYSTTATPAAQTPPGTIANCGNYYTVQAGDECNTVALRFGITFQQLRAMNPSLDETCSNLYLDESYCVALVEGTTVTATPTTGEPPTGATPVPPPGPTQPGATTECKGWYTAVAGDYCYLITTNHGITFEQFRTWNPYLDENCSNLWPDYSYCVAGP